VEKEKFEDIKETKPEEPQVPKVDLKPLPKWLKYEFLGSDKTYPVIVSDELSPEENEKLLNLLKKHKKVIRYSINDQKTLQEIMWSMTKFPWRFSISSEITLHPWRTVRFHHRFTPLDMKPDMSKHYDVVPISS
jgi:hypothetical protein